MSIKSDEMLALKAQIVEIDNDTNLMVAYQYHTEENDQGKVDRSKSKYRWIASVITKSDLDNMIKSFLSDENALKLAHWPGDRDNWVITCNKYRENKYFAEWLMTKRKKLRTWDDGQKIFQGWSKKDDSYNVKAVYETEGYTNANGDVISLKSKEDLLKHVGETFIKECVSKKKTKDAASAAA